MLRLNNALPWRWNCFMRHWCASELRLSLKHIQSNIAGSRPVSGYMVTSQATCKPGSMMSSAALLIHFFAPIFPQKEQTNGGGAREGLLLATLSLFCTQRRHASSRCMPTWKWPFVPHPRRHVKGTCELGRRANPDVVSPRFRLTCRGPFTFLCPIPVCTQRDMQMGAAWNRKQRPSSPVYVQRGQASCGPCEPSPPPPECAKGRHAKGVTSHPPFCVQG
jgi:hypothetical protein